jgi:O-antigen ligase
MPARLAARQGFAAWSGRLAVWSVMLVPPLLMVPTAIEAFRLPKLLAAETLGLLSLVALAWRLRGVPRVGLEELWRSPVVLTAVPLVAVASLGLATSDHPEHVLRAVVSLWIGAACLLGWTWGLTRGELERGLTVAVAPGLALASLGILQYQGGFQPFAFAGLRSETRLTVTSLAGNAGDLGAYLAIVCLIAQERAARAAGRGRWLWAAAALVCAGGLVASQTLTALLALAAGSVLFWLLLLPRRRAWAAVGLAALVAATLVTAAAPLRQRLLRTGRALWAGDLGFVLTHRLDGWRAAAWMLARHPWTGVGHGAYVTEYSPAKLALLERGARFAPTYGTATFEHAHSEYLQVAAETGWPGVAAVTWGLGLLARQARRRPAGAPRALAVAGLALLGTLAAAHFPFRLALTGYPALLFLAWLLHDPPPAPAPAPSGKRQPSGRRRARRGSL